MRMVSSPGKSIRRRREICSGLHALAHRRGCRRPCRRPFQATAGPTTAAPPGVATAPDRRSCTYVCSAAVIASFARFGRQPAPARGGVAAQLARDRGLRTPQPTSDLPYALALCATQRDLLAFSEHQIPPEEWLR